MTGKKMLWRLSLEKVCDMACLGDEFEVVRVADAGVICLAVIWLKA